MTAHRACAAVDSPTGENPGPHFSETPPAKLLRSIAIPGPAGRLEALLNQGAQVAKFAALVCHPHPSGGGTMHNKVVYHAMKVLNDPAWGFLWPTLRFNFRGTGLSQGSHDGLAESEDVQAAVAWLASEYQLPIIVVGFSFGAVMALKACSNVPTGDVRALALLGLPTRIPNRVSSNEIQHNFLHNCTLPKLFLSGNQDQFASPADLLEITAAAHAPKHLELIPGADHFFTGHIQPMQQALRNWLSALFPQLPTEQPQ